MGIAEPSTEFGLWPRVRAITGWPQTDEVAMGDLGREWSSSQAAYASVARFDHHALSQAWSSEASAAAQDGLGKALRDTDQVATGMGRPAALATALANEVTGLKNGIRDVIHQNLPAFGALRFLPDGVRERSEEMFVNQLAGQVNQMISAAAARVSQASAGQHDGWLDETGAFLGEVVGGFVDAAKGTGEFLLSLSPHHLITDPEGYGETWSTLAGGVVNAVQDPGAALQSAVSWDTWAENPGRALGQTLFGVLPGVGVAGKLGKLRKLDNLAQQPRREGCFVPGTPVLTGAGHRAIETLAEGDLVVATDPESGERGLRPVVATMTHTVFTLVDLVVADCRLSCSPEHPFWVEGAGWTKAGDLAVGDVVRDAAGLPLRVAARAERAGEFTVHNVEVADLHTFHVSARAILVHNKPRRAPDPSGEPKKRKDSWLKGKGIDPHEAKKDLPGPASRFDIYVDRDGNMYGVGKNQDPKSGEFMGNVDDYDE